MFCQIQPYLHHQNTADMKASLMMVLLAFCVHSGLYAQVPEKKTETLRSFFANDKAQDTAMINLMIEYLPILFASNLDSVFTLSEKILAASRKLDYKTGIIKGLNGMAGSKMYGSKPVDALPHFMEALAEANRFDDDTLKSFIAGNLGVFYGMTGMLDSAVKYQEIAIDIAKKLPDKKKFTKLSSDMGMMYSIQGKYMEAIQNILDAKQYFTTNYSTEGIANTCLQLGILFMDINDPDRSLKYLKEAKCYNDSLNNKETESKIYTNLGFVYLYLKEDYDSASIFFSKALETKGTLATIENSGILPKYGLGEVAYYKKNYTLALEYMNELNQSPQMASFSREHASVLNRLGVMYLDLDKPDLVEKYASESLQLSQKNKLTLQEVDANEILASLYAQKNDYRRAYNYLLEMTKLKDSLKDDDVNKKVIEATFNMLLKQKDNEYKLLEQENELNEKRIYVQKLMTTGFAIILVLVIILALNVYYHQRKHKKLNVLLDEKNKQLTDLNTTKDKLFSIISHDLRSPFNALINLTDLIKTEFDSMSREEVIKCIDALANSSNKLYNLIENLLEWSRIQRGLLKIENESFNLLPIVNSVVELAEISYAAKKIEITTSIPGDLVVSGDKKLLNSILNNLLTNALKFTPKNGSVTISSNQKSDGFVEIAVTDSGIGMNRELRENLFDIGKNTGRPGTEREPTSGLGLIIVKELVEKSGGRLWVESEEGAGSTFYFTIPAGNPEAKSEEVENLEQ